MNCDGWMWRSNYLSQVELQWRWDICNGWRQFLLVCQVSLMLQTIDLPCGCNLTRCFVVLWLTGDRLLVELINLLAHLLTPS